LSPVIEARGLGVDRGRRSVLRGVDMALAAGEGLALVGPNAAGKSTLVRALAGLLPTARGEVLLQGRPLAGWPRSALAQRVALVAAEDEAPDRIAVEDRVALGRYPHRGALAPLRDEDRAAVARALRQTEIDHLARRPLGTLSAGERQLAALARGLAQEPLVLLLDEPAAGVPSLESERILEVLDQLPADIAILIIEHDMDLVFRFARRITVLVQGQVLCEGTPAEIAADRRVHEVYLGEGRG